MTEKVKLILKDIEEYSNICYEYTELNLELPEEVKSKFLTKTEREEILSSMNNEELDYLISYSDSNYAKSYYESFKKN